ncbi:hypothetical protein YC2023_032787 [Brassica napus]
MANTGPDPNGSQFFIATVKASWYALVSLINIILSPYRRYKSFFTEKGVEMRSRTILFRIHTKLHLQSITLDNSPVPRKKKNGRNPCFHVAAKSEKGGTVTLFNLATQIPPDSVRIIDAAFSVLTLAAS